MQFCCITFPTSALIEFWAGFWELSPWIRPNLVGGGRWAPSLPPPLFSLFSSPLSNCKIHTTRRTFSHLHPTREERKEFLSLPRIISEVGLFKRLRFLHALFTQPRSKVAKLESSLNFGVMTPHCRCLLSPSSSKIVRSRNGGGNSELPLSPSIFQFRAVQMNFTP